MTDNGDGVRETEAMLPDAVTSPIVSVMWSDPGHRGDGADAEPHIAVFARASDALRAAIELQAGASRSASDDQPAVRIAIDTGETDADDLGATAIAHRCRQLLRAGHPGQILTSSTTVEIARASLDDTIGLRDLGTHHVRGIAAPVWIWQIAPTGTTASFPPLRTRESAAALLPIPDTSFIGRDADLAALVDLVGRHRLLSIVGAGGCGKTRLAIELALEVMDRFRHGMCWIDLAPVVDPSAIVEVTAGAVGLRSAAEITVDRIAGHLGHRSMLLLFDNCEHLVDDAAHLIASICAACPGVHVVATSREPLALHDEVVWRIPSLGVPEGAELLDADAGRLLLDRIRRVRPSYEPDDSDRTALAAICRRLDGIPLAIELAAARTRTISPTDLAGRLDERFALLAGGTRDAVARQRTLEASVAWSYHLLDDDEQRAFRRLSVFTGSFPMSAAIRLCDHVKDPEPIVTRLRDCSLLVDRPGPGDRMQMLEPVRWFARERLIDSGEADDVLGRQVALAVDTARHFGEQLEGPEMTDALEHLHADVDNLRAAMEWAVDHERAADGLEILAATSWYWVWTGRIVEMQQWLRRSGVDSADLEPRDRLNLLWAKSELTWIQGRDTGDLVAEAVSLAGDVGNPRAQARFLVSHSRFLAFTDPHGTIARAPAEREMCRREGIPFWLATSLVSEVRANFSLGRFDRAESLLDQLRVESRALRHPQLIADEISRRAIVDRQFGRYAAVRRAVAEIDEVADGFTSVNSQALVHAEAALVDVAQGDAESALAKMDEFYRRYTAAGEYGFLPSIALPIIDALIDLGRPSEAVERSDQVWRGSGSVSWRLRLGNARATALLAAGDRDNARSMFTAIVDEARVTPNEHEAAIADRFLAAIDRSEQRINDAEARLHRALETQTRLGHAQYVADNLEELAGIEIEHERPRPAAVLLGAAATIRDGAGVTRRIARQGQYESDVDTVREQLGDGFTEPWTQGSLLTIDQAVEFARRGRGERRRPATGWDSLTATEKKVAALVADGRTNPEIATALIMGRATVKTHVSNILDKLGLANRTQIATESLRRENTERTLAITPTVGKHEHEQATPTQEDDVHE